MKCPNCELEFEPKWFGQIYCQKKCMCRAREKRNRARGGSHAKKKRQLRRRSVAEDFIYLDKILKGCSRCPERRPNALQYHHIDPSNKTKGVSELVKGHHSFSRVKEEMAKCILLCANCHAVEETGDGYRVKILMSKANIIRTDKLLNGKVQVTFECPDGNRTYEYAGSSARAFLKGSEPSQLSGKLVKHEKK